MHHPKLSIWELSLTPKLLDQNQKEKSSSSVTSLLRGNSRDYRWVSQTRCSLAWDWVHRGLLQSSQVWTNPKGSRDFSQKDWPDSTWWKWSQIKLRRGTLLNPCKPKRRWFLSWKGCGALNLDGNLLWKHRFRSLSVVNTGCPYTQWTAFYLPDPHWFWQVACHLYCCSSAIEIRQTSAHGVFKRAHHEARHFIV